LKHRRTKRKTKRKAKRRTKKKQKVRGSRRQVLSGKVKKTQGGLTADKLTRNKNGKIVSKKASQRAKRNFKKNGLGKWVKAVQQARKALKVKGFVAIKKGTKLYKAARKIYDASK